MSSKCNYPAFNALSVTQDTSATCPPSPGTHSAMGMESLSAISGMRSTCVTKNAAHS